MELNKTEIHEQCIVIVRGKMETILAALKAQQEAANNETKSSAGDKFETGRAMAHFEQEKLGSQFNETSKLEKLLVSVNPLKICTIVETGSLVKTNTGWFYISVAIGSILVKNQKVFVVSPSAPLVQKMLGLSKGDVFLFNGNSFEVEEVL